MELLQPSRKIALSSHTIHENSPYKMNENETLLQSRGIRPTAIRLMILACIRQFKTAFSFEEISLDLETVDRSTIFRTLNLFEKSSLIHKFEDGLGHNKYCLLLCNHLHLTCKRCGKTYCLPIREYPQITLPDNFEVESIQFLITGLCADCLKHIS